MSRIKGKRCAPSKKQSTPPEAESVFALVELIRSIPDEKDEEDKKHTGGLASGERGTGERPRKRIRTGMSTQLETITIGRGEVCLSARRSCVKSKDRLERKDIAKYISLHVKKESGPSVGWILHVEPRTRKTQQFRVSYSLGEEALSPMVRTALYMSDRLARSKDSPHEEGCVWAEVDCLVLQSGWLVELVLSVVVKWKESQDISTASRTGSQSSIRQMLLDTWCPQLKTRPTRCSPQDFYEATYTPDKAVFDANTCGMVIAGLHPRLYPFQRRAVQWLLHREGVGWSSRSDGHGPGLETLKTDHSEIPFAFSRLQDADGQPVYVSTLFGVIARDTSRYLSWQSLRGGILAEEMGLGKTVEVIALILLHRRPTGPLHVLDPYSGRQLRASSASLIVTPAILADQWLSEFKRHAPTVRVLRYRGHKYDGVRHDVTAENMVVHMAEHDVVVTTYDVLKKEIWAAKSVLTPSDRLLRGSRLYERPKSPLIDISWWRVCIDEAQMVESPTTNVGMMATNIPRVNAWAISGTPVKDEVSKDIRGLFTFLRLEPYASDTAVWKKVDKEVLQKLWYMLCLRHTKTVVRPELDVPPQRRFVITMPFSAVEEQNYQSLFQELVTGLGLDCRGKALREDWDVNEAGRQSAMRAALDRLRQAVLNPDIDAGNRRGNKIRTIEEVLETMLERSEHSIRMRRHQLMSSRLIKARILTGLGRQNDARGEGEKALAEADAVVSESRVYLEACVDKADEVTGARKIGQDGDELGGELGGEPGRRDADLYKEEETTSCLGEARRRLRHALEFRHSAAFLCANIYHTIKSCQNTVPDSDMFGKLDAMETEHYELAKSIRKELLQETYDSAKKWMKKLAATAEQQIPDCSPSLSNGVESRRMVKALNKVYGALNIQAEHLRTWWRHAIQLLLMPLVDDESEEGEEVTGNEFQESATMQDEAAVYIKILRAAVGDRQVAITAAQRLLAEHELTTAVTSAKDGEGPCPEKLIELAEIRNRIRPVVEARPLSSLKAVISQLRSLSIRLGNELSDGSLKAATQLGPVSTLLRDTQAQQARQQRVALLLEQDVDRFSDTLNARIEYYSQMQALSDTIMDLEGPVAEESLDRMEEVEVGAREDLAAEQAKHRYLLHLKETETDAKSDRQMTCIICQDTFTMGVLSVCGHKFCDECLTLWRRHHNRKCPMCKKHLSRTDLHTVICRPQEFGLQTDTDTDIGRTTARTASGTRQAIYTAMDTEQLKEMQGMDLAGPRFTTKVDTLVRHLLWLHKSEPGAKSVVFSQFRDFLDLVAVALGWYRIGFASLDKTHDLTRFRQDADVNVFLLHARAHASGLNLVNASHVFLCEPLLNTALELQAIARVDRIGQRSDTTVWLYVVQGTVEESIYHLSVRRRLEHMGRAEDEDAAADPLEDASLEAANTLELQQASLGRLMGKGSAGEMVAPDDLWQCLFGHVVPE